MRPEFARMRQAAEEYCHLIEHLDGTDGDWLKRLSALLPRLHAAVTELGPAVIDGHRRIDINLDARFELYTHLRGILGDRDGYWMEFDPLTDEQCKSGSLADDLTDIYCELKHGLRLLDLNPAKPQDAFDEWRTGFRIHWGQHLLDAERHLYGLQASNRLSAMAS